MLSPRPVVDAELLTRSLLRSTIEAFRDYAIAKVSDSPTGSSSTGRPLTDVQQDAQTTRTALLVQTFYSWVRDDMTEICVFGAGDVIG